MKAGSLTTAAALVLSGFAAADAAWAQATMAASAPGRVLEGPVVTTTITTMNGTVAAIDAVKRRVVLKGPQGEQIRMSVGPDVRNFQNLKLGDQVRVRYSEARSLALLKGPKGDETRLGELRVKVEADAARQAAAGGKPGLSTMDRTTLVANVFDINRERGRLTLRGTDGIPVRVQVPDKQMLGQIGLNDQIVIGYLEAAVVSIEPGTGPSQAASPSTRASAPNS